MFIVSYRCRVVLHDLFPMKAHHVHRVLLGYTLPRDRDAEQEMEDECLTALRT